LRENQDFFRLFSQIFFPFSSGKKIWKKSGKLSDKFPADPRKKTEQESDQDSPLQPVYPAHSPIPFPIAVPKSE